MNIAPDMWPADTEALRTRITRLEVQSETRMLQVAYWQERARVMEAGRKTAIRTQTELRQEVADERGAALDLLNTLSSVQAVVDAWNSRGIATPPELARALNLDVSPD